MSDSTQDVVYKQLLGQIEEAGIPREEAQRAARKCATAMVVAGVVGYYTGSSLAYFLMPVTGGLSAVATPGLAGLGAGLGPLAVATYGNACADIRAAIRHWDVVE